MNYIRGVSRELVMLFPESVGRGIDFCICGWRIKGHAVRGMHAHPCDKGAREVGEPLMSRVHYATSKQQLIGYC